MINNSNQAPEISFIIFDLDGVLADTISSWVYIHEHFCVNNDVSYYAYINNEIDDQEFMRRDIALWLGKKPRLHIDEIQKILNSVPIMHGFKTMMVALKHLGIGTAIVSAGLQQLANRIGELGGIEHIMANGLELDKDGYLTGEGILHVSLKAKGEIVRRLISQLGLNAKTIAAVGNGNIDIQMFQESALGIAFNPHDQEIVDSADVVIYNKNLKEILNHICLSDDLPDDLKAECKNNSNKAYI